MKIPLSLLIVGIACFSGGYFARQTALPPSALPQPAAIDSPDPFEAPINLTPASNGERGSRMTQTNRPANETPESPRETATIHAPSPTTANVLVKEWSDRYQEILAETSDSTSAWKRWGDEVDAQYTAFIARQLAELPIESGIEHTAALQDLERRIREGAELILSALPTDSNRIDATLTKSLDLLLADSHYADLALTPEQRGAWLALDRERESRLAQLLSNTSPDADTWATTRESLEDWYATTVSQIVGEVDADSLPDSISE